MCSFFFFFKQKTAYEIMPSLVGSEMCIRDRYQRRVHGVTLTQYSWAMYIDPAVSFIIIGFLLLAGYREISASLPDLFDKTLDEELQLVILRELSSSFDRYHEFHGVRSRRSGSRIYIEIFLGFDPEQKMGDVQDFIDFLKGSLEALIPGSVVAIIPTRENDPRSAA
eukprot:TRINITY_DN357_c0_g1_i4.p9 TRINITY_DN357_c0_g1~~TRINITY_DN357_c0_g1_i4.p9  ORF type:complete len:167 (-),score=9.03 TRINITY_DN357_c0_g1_i4:3806-4306(-)